MLRLKRAILATVAIFSLATMVSAEDVQWPTELIIAGFKVINIRSSGPAAASGFLQLPGISTGQRVNLTRGTQGQVTGAVQFSFRLAGVEFGGSGSLTASGLQASGTVYCEPKPVQETVLLVETNGRFLGEGRLLLNALSVPVKISLASSGFRYSGTVAVQSEADTALAVYRFEGTLSIENNSGRLNATASGTVTRRGKLVDQVTRYAVSNIPVNIGDGSGYADIGGVRIRFKFF